MSNVDKTSLAYKICTAIYNDETLCTERYEQYSNSVNNLALDDEKCETKSDATGHECMKLETKKLKSKTEAEKKEHLKNVAKKCGLIGEEALIACVVKSPKVIAALKENTGKIAKVKKTGTEEKGGIDEDKLKKIMKILDTGSAEKKEKAEKTEGTEKKGEKVKTEKTEAKDKTEKPEKKDGDVKTEKIGVTKSKRPSSHKIFKKYVRPYLSLSISNMAAYPAKDGDTNSPPVETFINSKMPFVRLSAGLDKAWSPKPYDLFGKELKNNGEIADKRSPIRLKFGKGMELALDPQFNFKSAENYSITEDDRQIVTTAGLAADLVVAKGYSIRLYLNGDINYTEREWPSLALPSGLTLDGTIGLSGNISPLPSLEFVPSIEVTGSRIDYNKENLGKEITASDNNIKLGLKALIKTRAWSKYAPTLLVDYKQTVYGKRETPVATYTATDPSDLTNFVTTVDNRTDNKSGLEIGGGLLFDKELANLSVMCKYITEKLDGFNDVSSLEGSLAVEDIPFVANVAKWIPKKISMSTGTMWGGSYYYNFDMPYWLSINIQAPEALSLDNDYMKLVWGLEFLTARIKDHELENLPEYNMYGGAVTAKTIF